MLRSDAAILDWIEQKLIGTHPGEDEFEIKIGSHLLGVGADLRTAVSRSMDSEDAAAAKTSATTSTTTSTTSKL